jgi:5-methylcytosine-specific restriction endonuclease McrA
MTWTSTAVRTCVDCGEQRIVKLPGKVKERCQSCASKRVHRQRGHSTPQEYTCAVCGIDFIEAAFWGDTRKVCSKACQAELYRRDRKGSGNPNYRHGKRVGIHLRKWNVQVKGETSCRNCGVSSEALHLHHIIPRSKWKAGKADLRNGMALCRKCHSDWHHRKIEIYRDVFSEEEWAFVCSADLIDRDTAAWLDRHYPPRMLVA